MRPSVTRCGLCARALCDDCYRFRMNDRAACARCAYEASTRPARRVSLAASFLGVSIGGGVYAARRYGLWESYPVELVIGAVSSVAIAIGVALSGRSKDAPTVENREPDGTVVEEVPPPPGANPYRAGVRRVVLAASPRVSATTTALVMLSCFAASAVLLPASLHLPRWLEVEFVFGAWWAIVTATLSTLLFRGFRLRDDYVYFAPWNRPAKPDAPSAEKPASASKSSSGSGCSDLGGCVGCGDLSGCGEAGEGALVMAAVAVALAVAFGAAWVLVELAMPLVFFVMYALFMRAIARVANDRNECEGELARSIGWGAMWATVYVVPLAAFTWLLHVARR